MNKLNIILSLICIVSSVVSGYSICSINELREELKIYTDQKPNYIEDLKRAVLAYDSVKDNTELKELLIDCTENISEKDGVLEKTSAKIAQNTCHAAVAMNKAALALLVTSKEVAMTLKERSEILRLYFSVLICIVCLIPIVFTVVGFSYAARNIKTVTKEFKKTADSIKEMVEVIKVNR